VPAPFLTYPTDSVLVASATGFATGFSLILAIGAQNAFVLRQGLLRAHVFWICLICAVSDAVLISAGVLLAGRIGGQAGWAITLITWAGAGFLIVYGGLAAWRASSPGRMLASERTPQAFGGALLTCLALTWLNPHVYVETVGLIGAVSTGFKATIEKLAFGGGAAAASFVFFFGLGYGARLLAPAFSRPKAWAFMDGMIAIVMFLLAMSLIARTL
jgi:L-lysine exporter family protein LysE/ArgO